LPLIRPKPCLETLFEFNVAGEVFVIPIKNDYAFRRSRLRTNNQRAGADEDGSDYQSNSV